MDKNKHWGLNIDINIDIDTKTVIHTGNTETDLKPMMHSIAFLVSRKVIKRKLWIYLF